MYSRLLTLPLSGSGIYKKRKEISAFLNQKVISRNLCCKKNVISVLGWGYNNLSIKAKNYADKHGLSFWRLEDGFIGYLGHPAAKKYHRLSLIIDKQGIYYNAHRTSDLEDLLVDISWWWQQRWQDRADRLIDKIVHYGITKYNQYDDCCLPNEVARQLNHSQKKILLIDQNQGDFSVTYGLASDESFRQMLCEAVEENPGAHIIIRAHPDTAYGKKKGYLAALIKQMSCSDRQYFDQAHITLINAPMNPYILLQEVDKVYTVTSQMGFEALLAGKPVVCYGAPFYAGWGLTEDRVKILRRGYYRTLQQVFMAAYVKYCHYVDPISGQSCDLESILDVIVAQRAYDRYEHRLLALHFSLWRRPYIKPFTRKVARDLKFIKEIPEHTNEPLLVWGNWSDEVLTKKNVNSTLIRIEDGFLRSVGLGSNLIKPHSLIIDDIGMYYDPGRPSRLEVYLKTHYFTHDELNKGESIIQQLKKHALSKYNVGTGSIDNLRAKANDKKIILVPGQVSDDASVLSGSPVIKDNAELIIKVRQKVPDAFIVYKPHPDVASGNRKGYVSDKVIADYVDLVTINTNIIDCFAQCDQVHTLTSLSGLEALLHGLPVTVWGQPFYAGWGLTTDQYPVERRGRELPLSALVYAAYEWYPIYYDWNSRLFSTALHTIEKLHQEKIKSPARQKLHQSVNPVMSLGKRIKNLVSLLV